MTKLFTSICVFAPLWHSLFFSSFKRELKTKVRNTEFK